MLGTVHHLFLSPNCTPERHFRDLLKAFNRGCHLYSAGRPLHLASAHILVAACFAGGLMPLLPTQQRRESTEWNSSKESPTVGRAIAKGAWHVKCFFSILICLLLGGSSPASSNVWKEGWLNGNKTESSRLYFVTFRVCEFL